MERKDIVVICQMRQEQLKEYCFGKLVEFGYQPVSEDGFIFAQGEIPVTLIAHMDTVHKEAPIVCMSKKCNVLMAPQGIGGDDRCGIFMVLEIASKLKCSVIFTEDEETGRVGAKKFCKSDLNPNSNWIIEFDRKGDNDAVFYSCDNEDFTKFVTDKKYGFEKAFGSCSDISSIAPHLGIAAVNISAGYFNPHTCSEYIVMDYVYNNIARSICMINDQHNIKYEYVEKKSYYGNGKGVGCYSTYYGNSGSTGYVGSTDPGFDYDDDDDSWYARYNSHEKTETNTRLEKKEEITKTSSSANAKVTNKTNDICEGCGEPFFSHDLCEDYYGAKYCSKCAEILKNEGNFIYPYDIVLVEEIDTEKYDIMQSGKQLVHKNAYYYIDYEGTIYLLENELGIMYPLKTSCTAAFRKSDLSQILYFTGYKAYDMCSMFLSDINDMKKYPKMISEMENEVRTVTTK